MSLNRLFWLISIALMLLFSALAVRIVVVEWGTYKRGAYSMDAMRTVQLGLVALEKVSFERGPSNACLGSGVSDPTASLVRLQRARSESDVALTGLLADLRQTPDLSSQTQRIVERTEQARRVLLSARQAVDRLCAMPLARRTSQEVTVAVDGMLAVVPLMVATLGDLSVIVTQADPELLDGLTGVRVAASLREYAGQVGSRFTAPLVAQRPLTQNEVIEIGKLYGRIEQLRTLMDTRLRGAQNNVQFKEALLVVDRMYFGDAIPFLDRLRQVGLNSGNYGMTTGALAEYYVPRMTPLLRLRDILMIEVTALAEARHRQAGKLLLGVLTMVALSFLFLFVLMYVVRKRVVGPVLFATKLVKQLGDGNLDVKIPPPRHPDEIGAMLQALKVLKHRSIERISLAREREELIAQLQTSSNTDFLTGALNRRAFFSYSEQQLAVAQRYQRNLTLILLDIDYFKQINDAHGHIAGDEVLRGVVKLVGRLLRKVDIFARYGGEEFILLLPEADLEQGVAVAEKLRLALAAQTVDLGDGQLIQVTASFGVAALAGAESLDQLISLADEALYDAKHRGRNCVVRATRMGASTFAPVSD